MRQMLLNDRGTPGELARGPAESGLHAGTSTEIQQTCRLRRGYTLPAVGLSHVESLLFLCCFLVHSVFILAQFAICSGRCARPHLWHQWEVRGARAQGLMGRSCLQAANGPTLNKCYIVLCISCPWQEPWWSDQGCEILPLTGQTDPCADKHGKVSQSGPAHATWPSTTVDLGSFGMFQVGLVTYQVRFRTLGVAAGHGKNKRSVCQARGYLVLGNPHSRALPITAGATRHRRHMAPVLLGPEGSWHGPRGRWPSKRSEWVLEFPKLRNKNCRCVTCNPSLRSNSHFFHEL